MGDIYALCYRTFEFIDKARDDLRRLAPGHRLLDILIDSRLNIDGLRERYKEHELHQIIFKNIKYGWVIHNTVRKELENILEKAKLLDLIESY